VWSLKSRNHFFSVSKRRRKVSGLRCKPFGTGPPTVLWVCASFGEGSKARGRLAGCVHFRLQARQRPHPSGPGSGRLWSRPQAWIRPWVRRAEGYRETRQIKRSGQVPVTPRRPPSLPLVCGVFPDLSSFSVLRETPMVFFYDHFKQLKCYGKQDEIIGAGQKIMGIQESICGKGSPQEWEKWRGQNIRNGS
jgi:hypothetical protein